MAPGEEIAMPVDGGLSVTEPTGDGNSRRTSGILERHAAGG
jgi:hypothetical protein